MKCIAPFAFFAGIFFLGSFASAAITPEMPNDPKSEAAVLCDVELADVGDVMFSFLKNFLKLHPKSFSKNLLALYPELKWLTHKVVVSPEDANATPHPDAFSPALFADAFHPEIERTMTSLSILAQILKGDYDGFTKCQAIAPIKLKPHSFELIREIFFKTLGLKPGAPTPLGNQAIESVDLAKLDTLITYMVIHDLGKSKRFEKVASKVSGEVTVDHDRVLVHGLGTEPMLATSFERLPQDFQDLIIKGMQADFNMGQFAQGENVPASLNRLVGLDAHAFNFYFLHLFLDVAGSSGVKTPHGSAMMIEPVFNGFQTGYEFLPALYQGHGPDQVYAKFLQTRATTFGLPFVAGNAEHYAIARVALMSRVGSNPEATRVQEAFDGLDAPVKAVLIKELAITGNGAERAILPYYSPALIANLRAAVKAAMKLTDDTAPKHPVLDKPFPIVGVTDELFASMPEDLKKLRVPELEQTAGIKYLVNPRVVAAVIQSEVKRTMGAGATSEKADIYALRRAYEILADTYVKTRPAVDFSEAVQIFTTNMNASAAVTKAGLFLNAMVTQKLGILTGDGANMVTSAVPAAVGR